MQIKYFSELGDGWAPTVLDTEVEHDFIRQSQRDLGDAQNYFIGGSAFPETRGSFDYSTSPLINNIKPSYSPIQSGKLLKIQFSEIISS